MTVNVLAFVDSMTDHWQNQYHHTANPALQQSWQLMAEAFNAHIAGTNTHRWNVLHPPTGTGKSTGLKLYCSMLPTSSHPGALIVVRMKADATALALEINALSGSPVAVAVHGDNKVERLEQYACPVLVVTHSAYEHAMLDPVKWDALLQWESGKRKLTVIDEALDIIRHEQVHLDELRFLRGVIPHSAASQHAKELAALDIVISKLSNLANVPANTVIQESYWETEGTFSGLRAVLPSLSLDQTHAHRHDMEERKRLATHYSDMLTRLESVMKRQSLYARSGKRHILTSAQVILPPGLMNAVVLDATAAFNPIYSMLGSAVELIAPPDNIRSYKNVTLHVSVGHGTGKGTLMRNPQKEAQAFTESLLPQLDPSDRLLVCSHKAMRPHLEGYDTEDRYSVAHWGAIDGKNDWKDYSTVALFGLSYLDRIIPEASLLALLEWSKCALSQEEYEAANERLYWGHVTVAVIQAINRVRCRSVIDEYGNCLPANVYVLLPPVKQAQHITIPLASAMPGIQSKLWVSGAAKKKVRRSRFEAPLLAHLKTLGRGKHLAKELRQNLAIPQRTFENLIAKLKDSTQQLHHELAATGYRYVCEGAGRGAKSWFVME